MWPPSECSGTALPLSGLGNVSRFGRMSWGEWFPVVVGAGLALGIGFEVRARRQEAPLRTRIAGQPVVFETRALMRIRASWPEGSGWVTLKSPAGARLIVHTGGLEATIASAHVLAEGHFMRTSDATMWIDQFGIRLHGFTGRGIRDWAVTPRGSSIEEVWQALLGAGVNTSDPAA
jgi:hypothetical protein